MKMNFSKGKIAALVAFIAVLVCTTIASVAVAFSMPSGGIVKGIALEDNKAIATAQEDVNPVEEELDISGDLTAEKSETLHEVKETGDTSSVYRTIYLQYSTEEQMVAFSSSTSYFQISYSHPLFKIIDDTLIIPAGTQPYKYYVYLTPKDDYVWSDNDGTETRAILIDLDYADLHAEITSSDSAVMGRNLTLTCTGNISGGAESWSVSNGTGGASIHADYNNVLVPVNTGTVIVTLTIAAKGYYKEFTTTQEVTIRSILTKPTLSYDITPTKPDPQQVELISPTGEAGLTIVLPDTPNTPWSRLRTTVTIPGNVPAADYDITVTPNGLYCWDDGTQTEVTLTLHILSQSKYYEYTWNNAVQESLDKGGEQVTFTLDADWTTIDGTTSFGEGVGFTKNSDGSDNGAILVPRNDKGISANILLDLNGFNINRGLTKAIEGGNVITVNGKLEIKDDTAHIEPGENGDVYASGRITGGNNTSDGGGLCVDGGNFILQSGLVSDNKAGNGGGVAVINNGAVTINDGNILYNSAVNAGGGVSVDHSTFLVNGGTVAANTGNYGGGLRILGDSSATMVGGEISDNTANYMAGGVVANAPFIMTGGKIINNKAIQGGYESKGNTGGVVAISFTMSGGEISGNTAVSGAGGVRTDGTFVLTGGTISGNSTSENGGGVYFDGDMFEISGAPVISGNLLGEAENNVYLADGKTITITGDLLTTVEGVEKSAKIGIANTANGMQITTNYSTYHEDLPSNTFFSADGNATIVKYYSKATKNEELFILGADSSLTALRWNAAVQESLDNFGAPITFTLTENWTAVDGVFGEGVGFNNNGSICVPVVDDVKANIILDLNGFDIDRGLTEARENGRVIRINGILEIINTNAEKDGRITGGYSPTSSGGLYISGAATVNMKGGIITGNHGKNGGGVFTMGSFVMSGGTISGNFAEYGGGVYLGFNEEDNVYGTFTMSDNAILAGNEATVNGGGVYVKNGTLFKMTGGIIGGETDADANTAIQGGGVAIVVGGTFTMSGSAAMIGNKATKEGGGVYVDNDHNAKFIMNGGTVTGNSAENGGGVYIYYASAGTMSGGEISGNKATKEGGGVSLVGAATFDMSGGQIKDNIATENYGGVRVLMSGSFRISGSAQIFGNKKGTEENYVNNNYTGTITVSGKLAYNARIGVTADAGKITSNYGASSNTDSPALHFFSDTEDKIVFLYDREACLGYELTPALEEDTFVVAEGVIHTVSPTADIVTYVNIGGDFSASAAATYTARLSIKDDFKDKYIWNDGKQDIKQINWYILTVSEYYEKVWKETVEESLANPDKEYTFTLDIGSWEADEDGKFGSGTGFTDSGALYIPEGANIFIDLKGNDIDRNLTDPTDGGSVIVVDGKLTITDTGDPVDGIKDGRVTGGNTTGNGGGILVNNGGDLTIWDGSVSGNNADLGGGIHVAGGGSATITGGSVNGNTADTDGGGIYVAGDLTVGGDAKVNDNSVNGGSANNVYLPNNTKIIISEDKPLTDGAQINITTSNSMPYTFTEGYGNIVDADGNPVDPSTYFGVDNVEVSDDERARVLLGKDGEAIIVVRRVLPEPTVSGKYIYNGRTHYLTLNNYDSALMEYAEGSVTYAIEVGNDYSATVALLYVYDYEWADGTTVNKTVIWAIEESNKITVPSFGEEDDGRGTLVYDGTEQSIEDKLKEIGYDESIMEIVSGDKATDAGDYEVTIKLKEPYTFEDGSTEKKIPWHIAPQPLDISGAAWNYDPNNEGLMENFIYNGLDKKLELSGLPKEVSISYSGHIQKLAGTDYKAVATLTSINKNYILKNGDEEGETLTLECPWAIKKADYEFYEFGLDWDYDTVNPFIYDNKNHTVNIISTLPGGIIAVVEGNSQINANLPIDGVVGRFDYYIARVVRFENLDLDNFNDPFADGVTYTCNWQILPAQIDVSGVYWNRNNTDYTFNNSEKSVSVANVPANVTVTYVADGTFTDEDGTTYVYANAATDAGKYIARVDIAPVSTNYVIVGDVADFEWEITPIDLSKITVEDITDLKDLVYTGEDITLNLRVTYGTLELEEGVDFEIEYENNRDAGTASYKIIPIEGGNFAYPEGTDPIEGRFEISKKDIEVTVVWKYTPNSHIYSGSEITVTVETVYNGAAVFTDAVNIEYENNEDLKNRETEAGSYTALATLTPVNDNYNLLNPYAYFSWTVERASVARPAVDGQCVYNGFKQKASLNPFDETAMSATYATADGVIDADGFINAGDYKVIVSLDGNHCWADKSTGDLTLDWSIARATVAYPVLPTSMPFSSSANKDFTIEIESGVGVVLPTAFEGSAANVTIPARTPSGIYTITFTPDNNHCWKDTKSADRLLFNFYIYLDLDAENAARISDDLVNHENLAILMGMIMGKKNNQTATYGELKAYMDKVSGGLCKSGDIKAVVMLNGKLWQVTFATETKSGQVVAALWLLDDSLTAIWNTTGSANSNNYLTSAVRGSLISESGAAWSTLLADYKNYFVPYSSVSRGMGGSSVYYNEGNGVSGDYSEDWTVDLLWLPSVTEVSAENGLWGLSSGNYGAAYWLRSGYKDTENNKVLVMGADGIVTATVNSNYAVRPAVYFNLGSTGLLVDAPTLSETSAKYSATDDITFNISSMAHVSIVGALPDGFSITGNVFTVLHRTTVKEYKFYIAPMAGYCWSDDLTNDAREYVFEITKADYDIKLVWNYTDPFTYKQGVTYTVTVDLSQSTLNGVRLIADGYIDNSKENAGKYYAYATFEYDTVNYNVPEIEPLEWVINKATLTFGSNLRWQTEREFDYDGREHSVTIVTENLPGNVEVSSYKNNKFTNAGSYVAEVTLKYDRDNYNEIILQPYEWTIKKIVKQLPALTEETLKYTGERQEVTLTNIDKSVMTVIGNEETNALEEGLYYVAEVTLINTVNYQWEGLAEDVATVEVKWRIEKATYVTEGWRWNYTTTPFSYDGTAKSVNLIGLPDGVKPIYENSSNTVNTATDVGDYTALIIDWEYDTVNYEKPVFMDNSKQWSIVKHRFVTNEWHWDYDENDPPVYNGQEQFVSIIDAPSVVRITYTYEKLNSDGNYEQSPTDDAGRYRATATFSCDGKNYEVPAPMELYWEIAKADWDLGAIQWSYDDKNPFTYDGGEKSVSLVGVPDGLGVSYSDATATNARTYTATARFISNNNNYNSPEEIKTCVWRIERANYKMSEAKWTDERTFTYDGEIHSVELRGLPKGVTVKTYSNNSAANAGARTATVLEFNYDTVNYNAPETAPDFPEASKECAWTINPKTISAADINWNIENNASFLFNGKDQSPVATVDDIPLNLSLTRNGVAADQALNVGSYVASVDDGNFIIEGTVSDRRFSITKAALTASSVVWSFDENAEFLSGSKPDLTAVIRIGDTEYTLTLSFSKVDGADADWSEGVYTATATLSDGAENIDLTETLSRNFRLKTSANNSTNKTSSGFVLDNTWKLLIIINAAVVFILTVIILIYIMIKRQKFKEIYKGIDDDEGFYD